MTTFLLATRNRHKVAEIRSVLGAGFTVLSLEDYPSAPPVVEDGSTFAANARKKAETLAGWLAVQPRRSDGPDYVMADDSGLEVDALGGAPGVLSARFAAIDAAQPGNAADTDNNAKLLRLLGEVPAARRTARFRCAIAVAGVPGRARSAPADADPARGVRSNPVWLFEGICEGRIQNAPRGEAGFGYDPLFQPDGYSETFAELGEAIKNRISHRARALAALRAEFRWTLDVEPSSPNATVRIF